LIYGKDRGFFAKQAWWLGLTGIDPSQIQSTPSARVSWGDLIAALVGAGGGARRRAAARSPEKRDNAIPATVLHGKGSRRESGVQQT
jgi:hypothetical protein